jgi:AcrR family transcriptional regulator
MRASSDGDGSVSLSARDRRPRPQQQRSALTVDRILVQAAALLDEVGFDRLTTNLICARAGLTPPALYRHFANKYVVMEELGRRLMEAQNHALYGFMATEPAIRLSPRRLADLIMAQYALTSSWPGGRWIMRSLHSTPALVDVRLASHRKVADFLARRHEAALPDDRGTGLDRRYRVAVETGYAMIELMIDRPDLDADSIAADAGVMIAALLAYRRTTD